MNARLRNCFWLACLSLVACNRIQEHQPDSQARESHVNVIEQGPGITPFIKRVTLSLANFAELDAVSYTIAPRPGTLSRPVSVTYQRTWLDRYADYNNFYRRLTVPVFGLYAGYSNDVTVTLSFRDGSQHAERVALDTPAYAEPGAIYANPVVRTARDAGSTAGVDFIAIHNGITTPVVIDSDGNMRWVGRGMDSSISSTFVDGAFYVGGATAPDLYRLNLDGTWTMASLAAPTYLHFHHDLSAGKSGLLAEVDTNENGVLRLETVLAEIAPDGQVLKEWDMGAIFRKYMREHGDDPANFVRDNVDWFHMNSAIYSPADDTLIVSSRENFVAKLDYRTGEPKWLLGDPTKHWYADFPSLRALALTLTSGKAPIGQHTVSLTPDGSLLLFNNGLGSAHQPLGTAPGETRAFSAVSRYAIDEQARTAAETWSYASDPAIFSDICSSAYQTTPGHYLVAYSVADKRTRARVMGVDAGGKVAFDFEYPTEVCATVFIASPIHFEALTLK